MNRLIISADSYNAVLIHAIGRKVKHIIESYNIKDLGPLYNRHEHKENFHYKGGANPPHFLDPHMEPKVIERNRFAKQVAGIVDRKLLNFHYEGLIIAAEAKMLGELKNHLSKSAIKLLMKELPKDLLKYNLPQLEKAIFN